MIAIGNQYELEVVDGAINIQSVGDCNITPGNFNQQGNKPMWQYSTKRHHDVDQIVYQVVDPDWTQATCW